jgi:hypothetical protein
MPKQNLTHVGPPAIWYDFLPPVKAQDDEDLATNRTEISTASYHLRDSLSWKVLLSAAFVYFSL